MKKFLENILAIVLLCVTSLAFNACKGGDDKIDSSPVATKPNNNNGSNNNNNNNGSNNNNNNNGSNNNNNNNGSNNNNNSGTSTPTYTVTTGDFTTGVTEATLKGSVSGVDKDVQVGVIYGRSSDLDEYNGIIEDTSSSNNFEVRISDLGEQETYYYRAYAYIDNILYYGEVKSFTTEALKYTIEGKTYQMIKVEGGPGGTFFMMQTEMIPDKDFIVGMNNFGKIDSNRNGHLVCTEYHSFITKLREKTGLNWSMPTKDQWVYAASGGNKSEHYTYSGSNNIDDVAWYSGNSQNSVHGLALKKPNELGLYDMSGNFAELTFDENTTYRYSVDGNFYGGSWQDSSSGCTVTSFQEGTATGKLPGTDQNEACLVVSEAVTVRLIYQR